MLDVAKASLDETGVHPPVRAEAKVKLIPKASELRVYCSFYSTFPHTPSYGSLEWTPNRLCYIYTRHVFTSEGNLRLNLHV